MSHLCELCECECVPSAYGLCPVCQAAQDAADEHFAQEYALPPCQVFDIVSGKLRKVVES